MKDKQQHRLWYALGSANMLPWLGCRVRARGKVCHTGKGPDSFFFFLIEVWLIYSVVLVSGVQQSDSVIHSCIYFFSDSFPL